MSVYVDHEPLLVGIALLQTVVLTAYPLVVQRKKRATSDAGSAPVLALGLVDAGLALMLVFLSGGWMSPFYHFAITALVVPSFLLQPRGSILLLLAFIVAYLAILATAGSGTDGSWASEGRTSLFGHLMTAVMVIGAVQLFASLTRQLALERDANQLLAAQEERARIGREIHDGVAQSIYMLSFNLERTAETVDDPTLKARLLQLLALSRESLLEVRQYIFDLRPLLEGTTNLQEALKRQVRDFSQIAGIEVQFTGQGDFDTLSQSIAAVSYRLTQEGLANAFKHSGASQIGLSVIQQDDALEITIADNGRGMAGSEPGNGLRNMHERVAAVGGSLRIESEPGAGSKILARVPLT